MSKKFLAVIPARKGSKGIPNKNFRDLNGKRIIDYTVDHAEMLTDSCEILISTDNFEYLRTYSESKNSTVESIVKRSTCKIEAIDGTMLHYRAKHLAEDDTRIVTVLSHVLTELKQAGKEYLGVILLQPTVPFRNKRDSETLLRYLKFEATTDSSYVTFKQVGDCHPARMYRSSGSVFKSIGLFPNHQFSRRQDLPPLLLRDGCYYFIGKKLIDQDLQVGESPSGFIRHFPWTINLDEESDLFLAQQSIGLVDNFLMKGETL